MERDMSRVLLHGVGVGGYRSMPDMRYFGPLGPVSLLAGQNNSGKSNVIRFMERYLSPMTDSRGWEDEPRNGGAPLQLAMASRLDDESYEDLVGPDRVGNGPRNIVDRLLAVDALHPTGDPDLYWVPYAQKVNARGTGQVATWVIPEPFGILMAEQVKQAGIQLQHLGLNPFIGKSDLAKIKTVLDALFPLKLPEVEVIRAFREVAPHKHEADHSGGKLVETLADHQHPNEREREKKAKFDRINSFAQQVLEDNSVHIEIPAKEKHILVHQGGLVLPLEALGTGIHQVVILASAATLVERSLVCIEEPEVNLHPVLQRKLIRHLSAATNNQYLIATHSAHMLDFERANVIHVRKDESGTVPSPATEVQAVADVCADLGYRPSDVLQSNAVIWVEGPSDRTYLRRWLSLIEPDSPYVEGIHFSIMFYGGRLLSHLTGEDPNESEELKEFISLRRINRYSVILIDSDKTKPQQRLNATKERVIKEFDRPDMPGHAWVTKCRTIENYVPEGLLGAAIAAVHPHVHHDYDGDKWNDPMKTKATRGAAGPRLDKVRVSHEVAARWTEVEQMSPQLRQEVRRVYEFIVEANG